jgi:tellurite resistance protein TehA-like permease
MTGPPQGKLVPIPHRPEPHMIISASRMPLNFFSVPFGLAGLAGSWVALASDGRAPRTIGNALLVVAALAWLVVLAGCLRYVWSDRSALRRDLLDPVDAPFGSLAVITPMLLAAVMFGLGAVCWITLGPVVVGRRALRPALREQLLPTLAINVAPAAVASLAYFAIDGDHVDFVAGIIGGYGLLMALAQVPLVPMYARLRFSSATWAFTFCWAAVATTALHWLNDTRPAGYRVWEYVVVAAITTLIGSIAVRTTVAIARRQFLPNPATADARQAPA